MWDVDCLIIDIKSLSVSSAGCVGVHGFSSVWGLIAVGLFTRNGESLSVLGFVPNGGGLIYVRSYLTVYMRYQPFLSYIKPY